MMADSAHRRIAPRLVVIALMYVIVHVLTLTRSPLLWLDEATLNDPALRCVVDGRMRSSVFSDIDTFQRAYYWQPPVQPYLSAGMYSLFGFGVWQTRILPLLFGAASVVVFALILLRMRLHESAVWIATAVLAFDPLYTYVMRSGRMDAICIFFLLCGLALMLHARETSKVNRSFLAGLCIGTAGVTHPIAVSSALCFVVLHTVFTQQKRLAHLLGLCFGAALPAIAWIASAVVGGRWTDFREQFLGHGADHIVTGSILERLLLELQRCAHDYLRTPFVAVGLAVIVIAFTMIIMQSTHSQRIGKQYVYSVALWFVGTFLFNAFIMSKDVGFYSLYPLIAVVMMLAMIIDSALHYGTGTRWVRWAGWTWVMVLFCVGLGLRSIVAFSQWNERDPQTLHAELQKVATRQSTIYGEGYLWYAAYLDGHHLLVDDYFTNVAHPGRREHAFAKSNLVILEKKRCTEQDLKACSLVDSITVTAPSVLDSRRRDTLYSMYVLNPKPAISREAAAQSKK